MSNARIGIDFGMTNTVLFYYDPSTGPVSFLSPAGENGVIPTVVYSPDSGGRALIGLFARERIGHPATAQAFKLALEDCGTTKAERARHPAFRATKSFLGELLDEFKRRNHSDGLEFISLSVPETWIADPRQRGMDALRHVLSDLGMPEPAFISEPVAAAAYFAYKHQRENVRPFDGYAIVYDHGGGTLDLCFVRIQGNQVRRLDGGGLGSDIAKLGVGGVAYDRSVFELFASRDSALAKYSDERREQWMKRFEEIKRRTGPAFDEAYDDNLRDPYGEDQLINSIVDDDGHKVRINSRDMIEPFRATFAPHIRKRLGAFVRACAESYPDADFSDGSNTRVLLVGGFSEFYPVQHCVRGFFREHYASSDAIFTDHLSQNERWTATARGACLVAGGSVEIDESCPFTVGVVTYNSDGSPRHSPVVEMGKPVAWYTGLEPRFHLDRFRLFSREQSGNAPLTIYLERGGLRTEYAVGRHLSEVLPDRDAALYWTVGSRITRGRISLTFRNNLRHQRTIELGSFINVADGEFTSSVLD
jgi:molecular chaperone DnaK